MTATQHKRDGNSPAHLALIRQLPCCITGLTITVQAHHLKSGPARLERGIGQKATDRWAVPLCEEKHMRGVELFGSKRELEFFQAYGLEDPYSLAAALWDATGDLLQMQRVLYAHMNGVFQ